MTQGFAGIEACVFDAYGTLFDVHSAVARYQDRLGEKASAVSALWRLRQLEYTWLRSLMKAYQPFSQVTADALDFALESHAIHDPGLRDDLLRAYRELDAYPEVPETLRRLRAAGLRCVVLTNGSPEMIDAAVVSAGLHELLDVCLSVDSIGVYKPDPRVYRLAVDALGVEPAAVSFQSSNAWDAAGAAHFGFQVAWINRFDQCRERLPGQPQAELRSLEPLPALLGL